MAPLNVASCLHCGREWLAGDSVPTVCEECWVDGHRGFPLGCPVCDRGHRLPFPRQAAVDIDR